MQIEAKGTSTNVFRNIYIIYRMIEVFENIKKTLSHLQKFMSFYFLLHMYLNLYTYL